MNDFNVTVDDLPSQQQELISALKGMGGFAGNVSLRRALNWSHGRYWKTRDSLVDSGQLQLGRGRGGSVQLVDGAAEIVPPEPATVTVPVTDVPPAPTEAQLYAPIAKVLDGDWASDNRYRQHLVEITAHQGRRITGGTWTRPDVVVAALRVFQFVPGRHFDIITFEVKPSWDIDVKAVYEALAHRRAATQAFAWFHVPEAQREALDPTIRAICQEAKRQGVGVIIGSSPDNYDNWETLVEAERFTPDPESLNDFISFQLSENAKQDILAWTK